ncbi:MAG: pilV [Solimicrobium sp.]|nr:pilV [Solimicrobium sp.]
MIFFKMNNFADLSASIPRQRLNASYTVRCAGISLIEILVSLLILSFGIMGALRMQLSSIQATLHSNFYSIALESAWEMADRIRSNQHQVPLASSSPFLTADSRRVTTGSSFSYTLENSDNLTSPSSCHTTSCSSDHLASTDIAEWMQYIHTALPNGRAVICRDNAPWNSNMNSLTWDCASSDDNASIMIKLGWSEDHDKDAFPPPRLAVAVN